ncbi:hypothetical protein AXF42_Ash007030 [Apostasia shenzhenica]|uniref:DDE Tnp4 domain-containing protein n=1 Tax=Apostasia shenzhenica TaxID=1088818 RepID=A0A2I0BEV0_9ASPA|nr:hypothetical protein AXF42_Ash007030 [Apostasia shenzhenica]
MPAMEQLAVFCELLLKLIAITVCEFFQHSLETVSHNFRQILQRVLTLKDDFIVLPDSTTPHHPHIRNNSYFYPYFKDILGAIDGTHVPAVVPVHKQNRYRNRKDFISQNVMADVSFDNLYMLQLDGKDRLLTCVFLNGHPNKMVFRYRKVISVLSYIRFFIFIVIFCVF